MLCQATTQPVHARAFCKRYRQCRPRDTRCPAPPAAADRRQQAATEGSRRNNMPSVLGRPMRSPGPHATAPFMRDGQLCERRA